uniref:hypothetical protein n=1 Tax=Streptomyces sp. F12 TaxID=1436084 RepID=UPI0021AD08BD|nr:hypothetical protein [Streptomyces sp. F12]
MKLTVVGCGYLGATHAACMAELGHEVLGMDCDMDKVAILNSGKAPFHERDLDDMLARHTATGRLKFTASYAEAAVFADLHFIGVGTLQQPSENAYDLTHLFTAVRQLAPRIKGPAVIAVKSTVPVGTAPRVRDLLHEFAPAGDRVEVAWNPEPRLRDRALLGRSRAAAVLRQDHRIGDADDRHRLGHCRARQGVRERLPRHEDLLHQRHRRGL